MCNICSKLLFLTIKRHKTQRIPEHIIVSSLWATWRWGLTSPWTGATGKSARVCWALSFCASQGSWLLPMFQNVKSKCSWAPAKRVRFCKHDFAFVRVNLNASSDLDPAWCGFAGSLKNASANVWRIRIHVLFGARIDAVGIHTQVHENAERVASLYNTHWSIYTRLISLAWIDI